MRNGRIAVLADNAARRLLLHQLLSGNGWQVVYNLDPSQCNETLLLACPPDLWLIALEASDPPAFLDKSAVPTLFSESLVPERQSPQYLTWERRLLRKLSALTAAAPPVLKAADVPNETTPDHVPAEQIWLLAASTGGPRAVKSFLDALPPGLPLALLYAQHIDTQFESTLPQVVGRHNRWRVAPARQHQKLCAGEVVIVPSAHELRFAEGGCLQIQAHGWPGVWRPSFSQIMQNLARHFAGRCGVIVFSGMDNDCTAAAAQVTRQGVPIWTQSAESCACPAMPATLAAAGYSQKSGTPAELAGALARRLHSQRETAPLLAELL